MSANGSHPRRKPLGHWQSCRARKVSNIKCGMEGTAFSSSFASCHTYLALYRSPEVLTDEEDLCSVILVGQPDDWDAVNASVTREMTEVRDEGLANGAFKAENADHRRGKFLAVASGVSYGGGQMVSFHSWNDGRHMVTRGIEETR